MLKGPIEYNKIIREFDKDLVVDAFQYELKPLIKEVISYYSKHKITPNIFVLRQLLRPDEFNHSLIDIIEESNVEDISSLITGAEGTHSRFRTEFRTEGVLGKGGFGKVFLVQKKHSGEVFAMKAIRKEDIINYEMLESTLLEKRILQ